MSVRSVSYGRPSVLMHHQVAVMVLVICEHSGFRSLVNALPRVPTRSLQLASSSITSFFHFAFLQ